MADETPQTTSRSRATDLFAVVLLHNAAFHTFVATVAAIVRAAFVVVAVIAIAVGLVLRQLAR